MSPIVTLTTDFGYRDYYIGAIKGALLSVCSNLNIVEISHSVTPQNILEAAFLLRNAATEFPVGSVHLAVIDPGVGSKRRAIAVACKQHFWVGPDNGLLSFAINSERAEVREITNANLRKARVSKTFHGRDLFAPCAAHLAAGFPFDQIGPIVTDSWCLKEQQPTVSGDIIQGEVVHIDRFGNAITNIDTTVLSSILRSDEDVYNVTVCSGSQELPISSTYSDVGSGMPVALIGSSNLLELAVNGGNGASLLQIKIGAPITLKIKKKL